MHTEAAVLILLSAALGAVSVLYLRSLVARRANRRFRTVAETALDAVVMADDHGNITYFNPSAERMFGLPETLAVGSPLTILMPERFVEQHKAGLGRTLATGETRIVGRTVEVAGKRADGTEFPVEISLTRGYEGEHTLFMATIRDITERKKLAEAGLRMAALVESSDDAIASKDLDGVIQSWNRGAERLYGYTAAEAMGRSMGILIPEDRPDELPEIMDRIRRGEGRISFETVRRKRDGRLVPVAVTISATRDATGQVIGASSISRDISAQKEVERLKNEFISTVSHEIRTPLTSIHGSLGLLVSGVLGPIPPKAKPLVDIAYKNSDRLIRLINDILDIEKIESGGMRFQIRELELAAVVDQAVQATRSFAEDLGVSVMVEIEDPRIRVEADGDRLAQVLTNLLSNAAKFSPQEGVVRVTVRRHEGLVRVAVTDHGPGIPPAFHARVFEKFAQAGGSRDRRHAGTGLGLSIARAIVDRLGGRIGFESEPAMGTTFHVDLPEAKPLQLEPAPTASESRRLLICEDDRDVAVLVYLLLRDAGFSCEVCRDAEQAKERLAQHEYAALILDLILPGQDGVSLLRELRERPETRALPIVVVSVKAESTKRELNGGALGVIDWLQKPIDRERLVAAARKALGVPPAGRPRVLHVEDDGDLHQVVSAMLEGVAEVRLATGLEDAKRRIQEERFDIVLLDLALPDGSGLELLPLLGTAGKGSTPVVVFSAKEADPDVAQRVAAYLVKSKTSEVQLRDTILALLPHAVGSARDAGAPHARGGA